MLNEEQKLKYVLLPILGVLLVLVGICVGIDLSDNKKEFAADNSINTSNNSNSFESLEEDNNEVVEEEPEKEEIKEPKVESKTITKEANSSSIKQVITKKEETIPEVTKSPEVVVETKPVDESFAYSVKDSTVINSLNETYDAISKSEKGSTFTNNAKATFINLVDFLFYDGTINGVTFKELTDSGKGKVLKLVNEIDQRIEEKSPGYKDSISSTTKKAYNQASNLIKKGSANLNYFLENNLSEENYNSIIDAKDELVLYTKNAVSFLKNVGSSLYSVTKDKLKDWYQDFKNK